MHNFKELKVWQKGVDFTLNIYKATATFPKEEKFGLVSQIAKSAASIPSNIAEGAGRNGYEEFNNFPGIAPGSTFEIETQLIIAKKLTYIVKRYSTCLWSSVVKYKK
jgi:four helix bundle protein